MATTTTKPRSRIILANDLGTTNSNRIIVMSMEVDLSTSAETSGPIYSKWNQISKWTKSSGVVVNAYIYRASDPASFSERLMLVLEFGNQLDLANYKLCFGNA
jgi:hypothetical protein